MRWRIFCIRTFAKKFSVSKKLLYFLLQMLFPQSFQMQNNGMFSPFAFPHLPPNIPPLNPSPAQPPHHRNPHHHSNPPRHDATKKQENTSRSNRDRKSESSKAPKTSKETTSSTKTESSSRVQNQSLFVPLQVYI